MKDFDRQLDDSGHQEALLMGRAMKAMGLRPDLVICSNAMRARQTFDKINQSLDLTDITKFTDELYATDAPGYLEIASKSKDADTIMLIGHNPMLEDLALGLAESGDDDAISELQMGFRTAALAVIAFSGPPDTFSESNGSLVLYLSPADL